MARSPTKEKEPTPAPTEGDEEGEEEEYEIEAIIDGDRDMFPKEKNKTGYLCKWVGYDESFNTWVNEDDAENARDLIDEFWRKKKEADEEREKKKRSRARASTGGGASASANGSRTRKVEDSEMEDVTPPNKKARSTATTTTKASSARKGQREASAGDVVMDDGTVIGDMAKYADLKSWEDVVVEITTVERDTATNVLYFYCTLQNGERGRAPLKLSRQKFPDKMISFFVNHLKWSEADPTDK